MVGGCKTQAKALKKQIPNGSPPGIDAVHYLSFFTKTSTIDTSTKLLPHNFCRP